MMNELDQIIDMEYTGIKGRQKMSMHERAAQFAPFAALTGYDAVIDETARLTSTKIELNQEARLELDRTLSEILSSTDHKAIPEISITFFKHDSKKQGGAYITTTGHLKRIDEITRTLILDNGQIIPLDDILNIKIK